MSTVWLNRKYARSLKTKMTFPLYRGAKVLRGMVIKTQKDSLPLSLTLFESVRVWDSGYEIRNRVCVLPCSWISCFQETHSTNNFTLDSSGVHHPRKLPSAELGYLKCLSHSSCALNMAPIFRFLFWWYLAVCSQTRHKPCMTAGTLGSSLQGIYFLYLVSSLYVCIYTWEGMCLIMKKSTSLQISFNTFDNLIRCCWKPNQWHVAVPFVW